MHVCLTINVSPFRPASSFLRRLRCCDRNEQDDAYECARGTAQVGEGGETGVCVCSRTSINVCRNPECKKWRSVFIAMWFQERRKHSDAAGSKSGMCGIRDTRCACRKHRFSTTSVWRRMASWLRTGLVSGEPHWSGAKIKEGVWTEVEEER
jgi:hypothetical protein